jgi:8-oxo-dGTP pyrophosphatase MutT (NUDIX family)
MGADGQTDSGLSMIQTEWEYLRERYGEVRASQLSIDNEGIIVDDQHQQVDILPAELTHFQIFNGQTYAVIVGPEEEIVQFVHNWELVEPIILKCFRIEDNFIAAANYLLGVADAG